MLHIVYGKGCKRYLPLMAAIFSKCAHFTALPRVAPLLWYQSVKQFPIWKGKIRLRWDKAVDVNTGGTERQFGQHICDKISSCDNDTHQ